jgi:hypothetical protein
MTKFWKISNIIVLALLGVLCFLGTFYKHISFGLGLGDMFGYLVLYVGTLAHLLLTMLSRNKGTTRHTLLTLTFLTFAFVIGLNATIWRGNEYPWNGSVFYLPCPHEIQIRNQDIKKEMLIQMCTMDYFSEFTATWDGETMTIEKGEVKVPAELEEYISRPIELIEILPDSYETFENDKVVRLLDFETDTLKTSREYKIVGEIQAIRNSIPIMKVKIKKYNS